MTISYPTGRVLELWVRDTGQFDGIAIFVDGAIVRKFVDQGTHRIPLDRPSAKVELAVAFGGNDGGISAIVDMTDPKLPETLGKFAANDGLTHRYEIAP
jgi:hypothetical protein